ncbi:MAG: hypothetical protein ABIQ43_00915 [Sphingomonas sp.]
MPTDADVAQFETALSKDKLVQNNFEAFPKGFGRQYVGVTRGGRRFIYGNFFPFLTMDEFKYWRRELVLVCDGGRAFFGAEFDVASMKITHIAFNGPG